MMSQHSIPLQVITWNVPINQCVDLIKSVKKQIEKHRIGNIICDQNMEVTKHLPTTEKIG